ncbi:MAG: hypothetical protein FJ087_19465 [Deltaproteobacteria bacterium]|nr:hypothetical protein [Deltaproteobacteria bacterium]
MSEKSVADRPALTPEQWAAFLSRTEIFSLRFTSVHCDVLGDPTELAPGEPAPETPERLPPEVRLVDAGKIKQIHAFVPLRVKLRTPGKAAREVLDLSVTAQVVYTLRHEPDAGPIDPYLEAFKGQAAFHAWPFLREMLHEMFLRTGHGVALLPLLHPRAPKRGAK